MSSEKISNKQASPNSRKGLGMDEKGKKEFFQVTSHVPYRLIVPVSLLCRA